MWSKWGFWGCFEFYRELTLVLRIGSALENMVTLPNRPSPPTELGIYKKYGGNVAEEMNLWLEELEAAGGGASRTRALIPVNLLGQIRTWIVAG